MQEPFCSVPLVWIIQQDTLASRLRLYENMGWERLISHWKDAFRRADVIVFPDYSLPVYTIFFSVFCSDFFFLFRILNAHQAFHVLNHHISPVLDVI